MRRKDTVMVSLDTSTTITGYAIWINGVLDKSGIIDHSKEKNIEKRIEYMVNAIYGLIKKSDIVVIESTKVPRGVSAQRYLTQLLGAVWGFCIDKKIEYVEYAPSVWRKLIAGERKIPRKREEAKQWDIKEAKKLGYKPCDDNEADAILIGIARMNEFEGL